MSAIPEKTREFKGMYHVRALSPLTGDWVDEPFSGIPLGRIGTGVNEVILATNRNVEGEVTAIYLAWSAQAAGRQRLLHRGVPVGSHPDMPMKPTTTIVDGKAGAVYSP